MRDNRIELLQNWAGFIVKAAHGGKLTGKTCQIKRFCPIPGPRAGALELLCVGLESGALLRALSKNNCANLRQLTPWDFAGSPQCFMHGRYVRVESGWPDELAETMVRLADLGEHPHGGGRWIAGRSERGDTILPSLDQTPHWLLAGQTGAGKSVGLRAAVLQLAQDSSNSIVLIDGKMGESLKQVERLGNIVAPVTTEIDQARAALGWITVEMKQRYEAGYHDGRIILAYDEFQEHIQDAVIVDLLRKLMSQGRAAGVHCLLSTQHPTVSMFGHPSTRRNITGRLTFRVADADASRVAIGSETPRADHLLSRGDAYMIRPGACHRAQGVYVDEQEITAAENGGPSWRFQRFPEYAPENVGQGIETVNWHYTGDELAVALEAVVHGEGRGRMIERMKDKGMDAPGPTRGRRLIKLTKVQNEKLNEDGYHVCRRGDSIADPASVRIEPDVW